MSERSRRMGATCVCLALLMIASQSMALAPGLARAAASGLPSIEGRGRHRFVPQTGDWEGRVDGFPASFELVYRPLFASVRGGLPPYGFEDLVLLSPARCPLAAADHVERTISEGPFLSPLSFGGGFGLAKTRGMHGGLTGAHAARLSYPLHLKRAAQGGACPSSLRWRLHPARRRRVEDGLWKLRLSTGRAARFDVSGGGRLATAIPIPNRLATASCPAPHGKASLFIRPSGMAMQVYRHAGLTIELRFVSSTRARGRASIAAGGAACPARSISLRAKLIH